MTFGLCDHSAPDSDQGSANPVTRAAARNQEPIRGFIVILSRAHNYIFLHCRKAAGTSMKVALSEHFGPRDICLGAWQEIMQVRRFPNRQFVYDAANIGGLRRIGADLLTTGKTGYFWHLNKQAYRRTLGVASSHPTAARIKDRFPDEWNDFFKFSIVRNPFAVAVSSWRQRYEKNRDDYLTFDEFIRAWAQADGKKNALTPIRNWELLAVDNRIELDMILRYETLEDDIREISRKLGFDIRMPKVNAASGSANYREYYSAETRNYARNLFAKELDALDYDF